VRTGRAGAGLLFGLESAIRHPRRRVLVVMLVTLAGALVPAFRAVR
jgi:hypothetical protein